MQLFKKAKKKIMAKVTHADDYLFDCLWHNIPNKNVIVVLQSGLSTPISSVRLSYLILY